MEYYTILTDAGRALEAAALAGEAQYKLETCVLGDGTAPPDSKRTTIQNEVWRGSINTIASDFENPNWLVIETRIPPEDGGFTIREFGIYTDGGILFAIGSYPESYKPVINEGTGIDLIVRLICEVSNAASVTLLTDPSIIMASKKYVDEQIKKVPRRNVGDIYFHQGRSAPFGAVVADGGLVQREMYPDLWDFAQAQNLVITESAWQTQSTNQGSVGMYSSGDGTTTFRLPLMTDFLRGTKDSAKVGMWQGDAIRNITGRVDGDIWYSSTGATRVDFLGASGAFYGDGPHMPYYVAMGSTNTATTNNSRLNIDVSRVVPTASENRPKTLFLLPCIHAYNAIVPNAQADMHAMMSALNEKLDKKTYNDCPIFRANNASVISLPFNIATKIPLTAGIDTMGSSVGGNFVPKIAGYYLITATAAAIRCRGQSIRIYVNNVLAAIQCNSNYQYDSDLGSTCISIMYLTPNDTTDVRVFISGTDTVVRTIAYGECLFTALLIRGI